MSSHPPKTGSRSIMTPQRPNRRATSRSLIVATIATATLAIAAPATALPLGAFWIEVDNGGATDAFGSIAGHRTFDLYVQLQTGDVMTGVQFEGSAGNPSLMYTQTVFQHSFGGDTRSPAINETAFPVLEFDTYLAMGNLDGQDDQIDVQHFDTIDPNAITASWTPNVANGFTAAQPDSFDNSMWLARFSVTSAGEFSSETDDIEYLGGQLFLSGEGPNGAFGPGFGENGVVSTPNAFRMAAPTPGPITILAIAGAGASRRRRSEA